MEILIKILLTLGLTLGLVYALALNKIFFTFVKEGTAIAIARGGNFSHFIMAYTGHYLNDPRREWYDPDPKQPDWEVLEVGPEMKVKSWKDVSAYNKWALHLRLLERLGIYYYGFWPFFQLDQRKFQWTERRLNATTNKEEPWTREAQTSMIYIADFPYWLKLEGAEDEGGIPLNLDYLLTVRTNNPYKARYTIADWLARLTTDSNNAAKRWVGSQAFKDVTKENAGGVSGFVEALQALNGRLATENSKSGAPSSLGVTIVAASLQEVTIAGSDPVAIEKATTAQTVATMQAEATRSKARGDADAVRIKSQGDAEALVTIANAEKERIGTVYGEIHKHPHGVRLREVDAIEKAAASPGATIIWAQNPGLAGAAAILANQNKGDQQPDTPTDGGSTSVDTP